MNRELLTPRYLLAIFLFTTVTAATCSFITWKWAMYSINTAQSDSASTQTPTPAPTPLMQYAIKTLADQPRNASPVYASTVLAQEPEFTSYQFEWVSLGKKMSGQVNIPASAAANTPAIMMVRGYVPAEIFTTGTGTKNAAAALAKAGYITVAPDFFGYGKSDPEPADTWQARFEKPLIMLELIDSLRQHGVILGAADEGVDRTRPTYRPTALGMWAHSNGGQIALTTLMATDQKIPTTLWAPVTAPFPYSILYFGDEVEDEGKSQRRWIALFEKDYDVFEFSLTQHLELLHGPLQFQHGTDDDAALYYWTVEFLAKVDAENKRRTQALKANKTDSTQELPAEHLQTPIEYEFFKYPGANHNLQPGWDAAIRRDLEFFAQHLGSVPPGSEL